MSIEDAVFFFFRPTLVFNGFSQPQTTRIHSFMLTFWTAASTTQGCRSISFGEGRITGSTVRLMEYFSKHEAGGIHEIVGSAPSTNKVLHPVRPYDVLVVF